MKGEFPYGLYFLRHCRTAYNVTHRISGQSNPPIIDLSIDISALDLIGKQYPDLIIITSPLTRCVQTVSYFVKQSCDLRIQICSDPRIIERGMGSWEGEIRTDILRGYPHYSYCGRVNPLVTPPNGENFEDFVTRIDDFIRDLRIIARKNPVLICAHNQSLKLLKYRLTGYMNILDFWTSCFFQNGRVERIY